MATHDLSIPPSRERAMIINDIHDRSKYELASWSPEFDVVFQEPLEHEKLRAQQTAQLTFRRAAEISVIQRRDIFIALGGVWDPLDPKYDQGEQDTLSTKVSEFETILGTLGGAKFADIQRDAENLLKLRILRGRNNALHSNTQGLAIKLSPSGLSILLGRFPNLQLLPGTSFLHLQNGSYYSTQDGKICIQIGTNPPQELNAADIVTMRQMPRNPVPLEERNAEQLNSFNAPLWHNPAYLPNGTPNKFLTETFLQEVKAEGLMDILEHNARRDIGEVR